MDYATPNANALKDEETDTVTSTEGLRHTAAEKARATAKDVQNKATQLKNAATEKAQQLRTFAGDKASTIRDEASHKAQQVKQVACEKYEQSKAKAKDAHSSSEEYIREHPTKCVLGAFGVGLLIGLLARRR